jgi:DNA mismatch repair protein MutL
MQHNEVRIEVLPQSVVEKIAAGEVIERPASVLKELVENSIDANASKIDIVIEDSGFSLLQVTDNGVGMTAENLAKSILAHATSKIKTADDLYAIATMGFRGEALASVAAVSRLTISSSNTANGLGCSVTCEGGIARPPQPVSHVRGTTVSCRDLFFNVPARKKFMKTRKAERIALLRLLEQLFIPFPAIHVTAVFEGKTVFDVPAAPSLESRIAQVTGIEFAKTLTQAKGTAPGMEATLFFPLSDTGESRPRYQYLFVNLRRVDSETVMYAVREAFSKLVQRAFRPSYFCFIDVDPGQIDVNVHPTKQKIKFEKERELFGFIYGIIGRAIRPAMKDKEITPAQNLSGPLPAIEASSRIRSPDSYEKAADAEPSLFVAEEKKERISNQTVLSFPSRDGTVEKELEPPPEDRIQLTDAQEAASWSLISCYQVHEMYILAPIKNGILLIDQHAAHERILFEQALADLDFGKATSQQLLFPVVLQLSATEKAVVESAGGYFRSFGFEMQDFGGNAVSVSAIPAFMKNSEVERSARDMIQYLLDEKSVGSFPDPRTRFAAAFACGAAIKAGQRLSQEEMNALLNNLFSSRTPYTCPHGRPTVVRISLDELSRRFLR